LNLSLERQKLSKEEEKYKSQVLGQPISTANSKLRKMLLFKYVALSGNGNCYRCQKEILFIEDFSIEHKIAWLHNPLGRELFFDLDNISFSHRVCNSSASKTYKDGIAPNTGKPSLRRKIGPVGTVWCFRCKYFKSGNLFDRDATTWSGFKAECKFCRSLWRKRRYREGKSR